MCHYPATGLRNPARCSRHAQVRTRRASLGSRDGEAPLFTQLIRIYDKFSQKEIDQIVDVLAPVDERGARSKGLLGGVMTMYGQAYTSAAIYENVTIVSYGGISSESGRKSGLASTGDVALTIRWTKRMCK